MNLERLEILIGKENIEKLKKLNIIIIGIGGVGGYTLESIIRSGVENITIVDGDVIEKSNINRQLIVTKENINKPKVEEWKKRINEINPDVKLKTINKFVNINDLKQILDKYDYIVDACDDVKLKIDLIEYATKNNIKIISSMGTANKMDATKLNITTLDKTEYDPLAKVIRKELRKKRVSLNIKVVSSNEKPKNKNGLETNSYLPAVAGLLITNEVINQVCDNNYRKK